MGYQPRTLRIEDIEAAQDTAWHQDILLGLDPGGKELWTLDEGSGRHHSPIIHGERGGSWYSDRFGLPADMTGMEVLEVGACEGLFSFEAEHRGATVTALDVEHERGFFVASRCRGSQVSWRPGDITRKSTLPRRKYDMVMCFGVLYHLVNPLAAIENLRELTGGTLLLETAGIAASEDPGFPCWRVYEYGFAGDSGNYWYCNYAGLRIALGHVGFAKVERIYTTLGDQRFTVWAS